MDRRIPSRRLTAQYETGSDSLSISSQYPTWTCLSYFQPNHLQLPCQDFLPGHLTGCLWKFRCLCQSHRSQSCITFGIHPRLNLAWQCCHLMSGSKRQELSHFFCSIPSPAPVNRLFSGELSTSWSQSSDLRRVWSVRNAIVCLVAAWPKVTQ